MQKRKIPMRKCIASQEMKPKKELIRIVRNKEGEVSIDQTGKKPGRGAYVTLSKECILLAQKKNSFKSHLGVDVNQEIYDELLQLAEKVSKTNE